MNIFWHICNVKNTLCKQIHVFSPTIFILCPLLWHRILPFLLSLESVLSIFFWKPPHSGNQDCISHQNVVPCSHFIPTIPAIMKWIMCENNWKLSWNIWSTCGFKSIVDVQWMPSQVGPSDFFLLRKSFPALRYLDVVAVKEGAGKWVVIKPVMALITLETWREVRKANIFLTF